MKKAFIICFLLMMHFFAESQTSKIDSFRKELSSAREDTNKVKLLNRLAESDEFTIADTAIILAEHAYALADSLHYPSGMAFAELLLSGAYTTLGNYRLALYYSFKCRDLSKEINIPHLYIRSISHLKSCYSCMGEFDKALYYAREMVPLVQKYFPNSISYPYVEFAKCFEDIHNYDSAIYYAKKSLTHYGSIKKNADEFVGLDPHAYILNTLASAYLDKGYYDTALFYFRNGISAAITTNIGTDLIDVYNGLSSLFMKTGNRDSACFYCKKVIDDKMGKYYPAGLLLATETLWRVYRSESKTDSALKYLEAATMLKDSLFNSEKTISAENITFSDQEKQKELEASHLKYQNQLKIFSLAGGFLVVLVISLILYRHNRQRQRAYTLLVEQQRET
ncbi:MAG TPA: hypothetical protein VKR53_08545, partial [Puia sp.]|nr:hypothetical protein [Puia sp.]